MTPSNLTFQLALARARAAEAAELAEITAGRVQKPSRDPREILREHALANWRAALSRWIPD